MDMGLSKLQEIVKDGEGWHASSWDYRFGHNKGTEQQQLFLFACVGDTCAKMKCSETRQDAAFGLLSRL